MGFSQRSSGDDHPHPTASESCQPSFVQGSSLKMLDWVYSFPSHLSRVVENFLFCIILLMERKGMGWGGGMECVRVSPYHMGEKKEKRIEKS